MPPGPEPTIAALNPFGGARAMRTAPCARAYSLMKFSIAPMQIGSERPFKRQDPSQRRSWGQTREQISGMLLVEREISAASRNLPSAARAIHSGMRLESGQALTQLASGHCMQRLACSRTVA